MYAMEEVSSTMFRVMMSPHEEKTINLSQLTYYDHKGSTCIDNVLPMVYNIFVSFSMPSFTSVSMNFFQDSSLVGYF